MTNYIFVFDGIGAWDGQTSGVMDVAAAELKRELAQHGLGFEVEWVDWPAAMAGLGPLSWTQSTEIGVENFEARVQQLEPGDKYIILAFSGGNRPAHMWLERTAEWNPKGLDAVLAVGLVSDPYRPFRNQQVGMPLLNGYGIVGEREGPISDRTFWVAYPGDVITDAQRNALLRTAADFSDFFPGDLLRGFQHVVHEGNFQLAWKLKAFRENPLRWFTGLGARLRQARGDIMGYMTGLHTVKYIEPFNGGDSPVIRLAKTISWKVRNP